MPEAPALAVERAKSEFDQDRDILPDKINSTGRDACRDHLRPGSPVFLARPVILPFTMEAPVGFPLPNRPFAPPRRRRPNRRVTTTIVTVSALAASLLVSGGVLPAQAADPSPAPLAPPQTPFPLPKDPDAPLRAAVAEARKQNKPIEAIGAFTETSRTWAFPDGSLKTESYSGPAQVRDDNGRWTWIDTTLVEQDGVLKPKVAKADLAFSLGGTDAPFAVMKRDTDQSLSLSWDGKLPRPVVKGNVATYPDAAGPAADLVVTALPTGFQHDVVLRERPKKALEIRIPVESQELTLAVSKRGGLELTEGKDKKVVAQAPKPVMWDSTGVGTRDPKAGEAPRNAPIATSVIEEDGKRTLVLKPDADWLADPATVYPVVVDPTSTLTVKTDTLLSSGADCKTNDQPGATLLKIGAVYSSCNGVDAVNYWRSYLTFDVASLANKPIISSTMQLWRTESPACHQRGNGRVYATRINTGWTPGRMTWSNKPSSLDFVATPCPTTNVLTPGVMTWPITNWVKDWAAGQPNYGVGLEGPTENVDRYSGYSAVFHSAEMTGTGATPPKLITQYILPPEIPTVTAESVDSMDGDHAIVRKSSAKVGYKSTSVDGRNIDYYVSVVESTAPLPSWTTGGGEVGKWSFTDGTGGIDSSGKGNILTFVDGRYSWIDGKDGKALLLNGTAGIPSHASTAGPVLRTDKSFSAAGWVRLDVGTSTIPLISQNGTVNSAFSVGYDSTARKWNMQMYHNNTATSPVTEIKSSTTASIGTWTHLAGVYDATAKKIRLYVNGVQAAEADYTVTPWRADRSFELGDGRRGGVAYSSVKAAYDEIRAYDRALSPTEIQWMLNLTPPTNANLPSGQAASITYDVSNVDSFKFSVRACINGATPITCSESPYYRITTDAPYVPTDAETGMADPTRPILSGMVNRPSGGPVTAKYFLYDNAGTPIGSSPLGARSVNGGERASFQVAENTVQAGRTYKWQMQACVVGGGTSPGPDPNPTPSVTPTPNPTPTSSVTPTPTPTGNATPPTVVRTAPVNGAREVTPYTDLVVTFSERVTGAQIEVIGYHPDFPPITIDGPVRMDATGKILTLDPVYLPEEGRYVAKVTGAKNLAGNTMAPYQWTFYTLGAQASTASKPNAAPPAREGIAPTAQDEGVEEICTAKTAAVSFTTPGTPTEPPAETVNHLTLLKDNFVIKTARLDPTACDGSPCTVTDSTVMRIGGTGVDKMAAVIGFRLDELPDGAGVSEGILKLGTPICPAGACPADTVITVTPLKSPVTAESKGSDLPSDVEEGRQPYSLPISTAQTDIVGSEYQWLLLASNKDEVITFGEPMAAEQPSLALTYLPAGPPSEVLNLTASGGDASAIVSWGLPRSNGSVAMLDGYDVRVFDAGGTQVKELFVTSPWAAIAGLAAGIASYTVKVRSKTVHGVSEWEAVSFTTRVIPPPSQGAASRSCVSPLSGQPFGDATDTARSEAETEGSGRQIYLDRVAHYFAAQDAVLEGRAATIWEAPGVAPSDPNTPSLSLLNVKLLALRDLMHEKGKTLTASTVTLDDPVVYADADGTVYVNVKVTRKWAIDATSMTSASRGTEKAPSAVTATSGSGGFVEPIPPTISIFVLSPNCGVEIITVPLPEYQDSNDFFDDQGSTCGSEGVARSAGATLESASCSSAGNQLFYIYNFYIAYRPGVTPKESVSWITRNFSTVFPLGGCAKVIRVGQVCELEDIPLLGLFDTFPIKVVGVASDHFTFEALEEHFEPTGSLIRFSVLNGTDRKATGVGKYLWLRVTAWGNVEGIQSEPWKSLLLVDPIRHDMWAKFARNIAVRMPYDL
ncbi:LamG-like jellyroll fold domain-containing protein [Streptosporangium sp. NPDC000509]|uniref:LamG-like jellyroll fold domain-containing protein n=1 Tax=Streptosporangium sp. NPDC000509 TaxID=3366186 RepID=UPI0036C9FC21